MPTTQQLKQIFPNIEKPNEWSFELDSELPNFGITTTERIAAFLAQTGHESAEYNVLEENLNYSAVALQKVFRKYFPTEELAKQYARKPIKIASRVYANRMGNGPEDSQEGWLYRGRGLIQCTGKNNYAHCSQFLFDDDRLVDEPELLTEPKYALLSALWYWDINNLNEVQDFVTLTKRINGGTNGLAHRRELYERALSVLDENV